jgi:steroid 5-alpha reductase family enzyme
MAALPGAPAIMALSDCASFATTAKPYLPQLYDFPLALYKAVATSSQAVFNLYADTNPLLSAFAFSLFAGVVFLVVSEINKNYSQVDRMWPIMPLTYAIHFDVWARQNGVPTARNDLAVFCLGAWSTRLFFNYWRKGGYSIGSEDYRWNIIKDKIGGVNMFVLNVTFISFMQSVSLFTSMIG